MKLHPSPGKISTLLALTLTWLWLGPLWLTARTLAQLPPWLWLVSLVLLAALPAWGLWLAFMVGKRSRYLALASDSGLRHWLSGGFWPAIKAVILALLLCAAALWQAYFLAPLEWLVLGLAPVVLLGLGQAFERVLVPQFRLDAYAWLHAQRWARAAGTLVLGALWLALMLRGALEVRAAHPGMAPQQLDAALATIAAAPSGVVRWGLDALLVLQVGGGALRDWPAAPWLRTTLLALSGPGLMLTTVALVLQGASGCRRRIRHAACLRPANRASVRTAVGAFVTALALAVLLATTAALEALTRDRSSPLALQRLPRCERIAGAFYTVGTTEQLQQLALRALGQTQAATAFCSQADAMTQALDNALERYLDWYFSLGAEWGRIFYLLAGDSERFLQERLRQTLQDTPGLAPWLDTAHTQQQELAARLAQGQRDLQDTLRAHHLALDASQCLVQAEIDQVAALPELHMLTSARQRATASAAAGLGAAAFASAVAAKAMGKTGMKAAAKVLAKAAAKQGLAKSGAIAAGAVAGSVLPGAGTTAGALAGAALGTVVSLGIDWTALRVEEQLTRDAMKTDLRTALQEQVDTLTVALRCPGPGVSDANAAANPGPAR